MNKFNKAMAGLLSVVMGSACVIQGYKVLSTIPLKGELANEEVWDKALNGISEPVEDLRVLYAHESEMDIGQIVDSGDLAQGVLPAGKIETFDLSFMKTEDEDRDNNGEDSKGYTGSASKGTTNYYKNQSKRTGSVASVPKVPKRTYTALSGKWCVYQGSALIKSFNAYDFPAKYQAGCRQIYNQAIKGYQSTITCDSAKDLKTIRNTLQLKYGISMGMEATLSGGKARGYFMGLQANRVNSASHAERIVKQLFPNGATENQVVWGCCNWLMRNTRYTMGQPSSDILFSKGYGNCNAYASALKQMCNAMGLSCDIVAGQAYGTSYWGGHAWNAVYINGVRYNVDACFYATSGGNGAYVLSPTMWSDHRSGIVNNDYINS